VLDLNFASEFARRADIIYKDEDKFKQVFSEYRDLEPREANIIYQSFNYKPGTPEHLQAKTRISALVASGVVSSDLAYLANLENIPSEDNIPESYMNSRMLLESELSRYEENGKNPLDLDGKFSHMINRGDFKSRLIRYLNQNTYYQSLQDLLEEKDQLKDTDLEPRIAIFKFEQFLEALNAVEDLPTPPDFAKNAKEAIKKYDTKGSVAKLIDSGAKALEVFNELNKYPDWMSDATDFITRDYVDSPRYAQTEAWGLFLQTINAIKDLDDR
jgi:hypothetical protein